ncbi:hypothetical protein C2I18_27910 [Paenibacillus sp. PK3_47]|uniref:GNAT family N-acetyltransferase n=1 Tax=Paenibacillus sp. PK3_47 TaxID=2072642 RepID=UPI00201DB97E|nr:GNAT family N-acetyltransferase [Paenibacillus sp. PK3_47]UQZ37024.1 hypothetical protein C2I18_27910 [Paenibacillus sp. PK3_47]
MIPQEQILSYLRKNPLKNITPLKMLTAYHQVMDSILIEQNKEWGILLLLPAKAFPYDQEAYPQADLVVMMDCSSPEVIPALVRRLPPDAKLVFKLQQENRIAVQEHLSLQPVCSFYSYTASAGRHFPYDNESVLSETLHERLLPLWRANGYSSEELEHYFQEGAFSVSIFDGSAPLSTCFIFRNTEQIWEIGGVHTAAAGRRKGFAQRLVRTAVYHILQRGYVPRYQVLDTNLPSVRLAESAGLTLAVKLEHWTNY